MPYTTNIYKEPRKLGLLNIRNSYLQPQTIKDAAICMKLKEHFAGLGENDWLIETNKDTSLYLCESKFFDYLEPSEPVPVYIPYFQDDITGVPFLVMVRKL